MSTDKIVDLVELTSKWMSLGQGNHSDLARWHHALLKSVVDEVVSLNLEIGELKKINENKSNELRQLKASPAATSNTPVSFAPIIAGQSTESKQQQHELINFIPYENKDRQDREQNIIISGLAEYQATTTN